MLEVSRHISLALNCDFFEHGFNQMTRRFASPQLETP